MYALFFDIDGTLIRINGSGRLVMKKALMEVFGAAGPIDTHSFAGETDTAIIYELMDAAGFTRDVIESRFTELLDVMEEQGRTIFFEDGLEPCPGIQSLLSRMAERDDVLLGLLTGNSERTAQLKLEAAGIAPEIFEFGAYGSDAYKRNQIAEIAWKRAEQYAGTALDEEQAYVIGDTPADIACGHHIGIKAIAVATGTVSRSDLAMHSPDLLVDDLSDTELILSFIRGE